VAIFTLWLLMVVVDLAMDAEARDVDDVTCYEAAHSHENVITRR